MKLFKNFRQRLSEMIKRNKQKNAERHERQRVNNSRRMFQTMEFDGKIYISYDGVPIVRTDDLKNSATKTLAQSRSDYMAWRKAFEI